jgi:hypothetical protein
MLIYGNTPKDITKMVFRNKTKILLLVGAVVLAVSLGTNRAEADETDKTVLDTVKAVPTKVVEHISNEVQETKEYQAKSWAEAKAQWLALKTKFLSK